MKKMWRTEFEKSWNLQWTFVVSHLKIRPNSVDFSDKKVNIILFHCRIGNDVTEKVGDVALRLISNHHCPFLHHSLLDFRCHFTQQPNPLRTVRHTPEPFGHVPKASIHTFRILNDYVEFIRLFSQLLHQILVHLHQMINMILQAFSSL